MKLNEKVVCADGFEMSVQAHAGAYCIPKMTDAPVYREVEVGFPNRREILLLKYADDPNDLTETVYGWVPVRVVTNVIAKHGGIVTGEVPRGVIPLEAS
jgi:hypothetical protein